MAGTPDQPVEPTPQTNAGRITKVEEQVAYAQNDLDHVSREMGELYSRIATLAKRVEELEARLGKLAEDPEEPAN